MKKFFKFFLIVATVLALGFTLSSCSSYSFYDDFHDAGAKIEKDNCFELKTVNQIRKLKANSETDSFVVILGASNLSKCVTTVTRIQDEADIVDYTGTIMFINVKSIRKDNADIKNTEKYLGLDDKKNTLYNMNDCIALMYKDGELILNSNDLTYGSHVQKFIMNSTSEEDMSDGSFSFRALVDYINESEVYSRNVD